MAINNITYLARIVVYIGRVKYEVTSGTFGGRTDGRVAAGVLARRNRHIPARHLSRSALPGSITSAVRMDYSLWLSQLAKLNSHRSKQSLWRMRWVKKRVGMRMKGHWHVFSGSQGSGRSSFHSRPLTHSSLPPMAHAFVRSRRRSRFSGRGSDANEHPAALLWNGPFTSSTKKTKIVTNRKILTMPPDRGATAYRPTGTEA